MTATITTNSNTPVNGISTGREFSLAVSGTFDGATIRPQYATAAPTKAALTIDDNTDADAIVLTATDAGTQGNAITIAITVPASANATLSHTQTGKAFVLLTATDAGDAATATIGTGADGEVDIEVATAGPDGNLWDVVIVNGSGENVSLSASISYAFARPRLVITLGTDGAGDPDDTKNTATLVAAAIDALDEFSATATGTGADPVAAAGVAAFSGGGANTANTTTVAQALAYLGGIAFQPHFTVALAGGATESAIIKPISATNLASGTDGTFANYADTATALTAAGEIIVTNPGVLPTINLNVASAGGSTSILAIVKEIPL